MAYKTQPYLALGISGRFWRSCEIEGEVLRIKRLLAGPIEVPLPPSAVEVRQGPLRKMLNLGDVVVRAMDGKEYVCDKVENVSAFVRALRNPATAGKAGTDDETKKTGGKDDSTAAKSGSRVTAEGKSLPVRFATGQSLEQHKAFFATCAVGSSSLVAVAPELRHDVSAVWRKVAEWDASHSVPKRGDGKGVNPPTLVAWLPDGKRLVTACDAFGLTRWLDDGRYVGGGTPPYSYGEPVRFFCSPDSGLVLLEAQTGQNNWWSVQNEYGTNFAQFVNRGAHWGMDVWGGNQGGMFNPWRPGMNQLLVTRIVDDTLSLDLIKVADLPAPSTSKWIKEKTLADVPVVTSITFKPLGAQDKWIMRYAWHPSGQYLAATTGIDRYDDSRRVHVLHFETAEIVASIPATITALGWSPGGRLLLCQQKTDDDTKGQIVAWDSNLWALRELTEPERLQPWVRQLAFCVSQHQQSALNADGTRMVTPLYPNPDGRLGIVIRRADNGEIEAELPLGNVPHAAWSPTDPYCLATVGGDDAPRSLRIWRLVKQ